MPPFGASPHELEAWWRAKLEADLRQAALAYPAQQAALDKLAADARAEEQAVRSSRGVAVAAE
jgi:hypothetical protein